MLGTLDGVSDRLWFECVQRPRHTFRGPWRIVDSRSENSFSLVDLDEDPFVLEGSHYFGLNRYLAAGGKLFHLAFLSSLSRAALTFGGSKRTKRFTFT